MDFITSFLNRNKPKCFDSFDARDYEARAMGGEVTREDISSMEFNNLNNPTMIDQKYTDNCVACSRAYAEEQSENVPMSWRGAFALGCKFLGYIPEWGISIAAVCMGSIQYGTPEEHLCKYNWFKSRKWNADHRNITEQAMKNAAIHKQGSMIVITPPTGMDQFDAFRAYLNKFSDKKIAIQTGVDGHAATLGGQSFHNGEMCLTGPDSYGTRANKYRTGPCVDGIRYFNRADANKLFRGRIVFDLPKEIAELLHLYDEKVIKTDQSPNCFLVAGGEKHFIPNEKIAWSHGYLLQPTEDGLTREITKSELETIPTGDDLIFEGGKNEWIVRRIYELNRLTLK